MYAQKVLFGSAAGWRTLFLLPPLMALGVGVAINNTRALIEAFWTHIRKKESEFVRTPKYGLVGQERHRRWQRNSVWTVKSLWQPMLEIAFGLYTAMCLYKAVEAYVLWPDDVGVLGLAGIPFLMIFSYGYFYVGFGTLHAMWKMHQHRSAVAPAAAIVAQV